MKVPYRDKAISLVSAGVLLYLLGYGTAVFGWFPDAFLERGLVQAVRWIGKPHYLQPRVYDRQGVRVVDPDRVEAGLTLVVTHLEKWDWQPGLRLLDRDGRAVHEWRVDPGELFAEASLSAGWGDIHERNVHGTYLFPNGDALVVLAYTGIARIDACGETLWSLPNGAHHSIARTDDGTFWAPVSSRATRPSSRRHPEGFPGLDRRVHHDRLIHLAADGSVLDSISVIDLLYRNDLVRYLAKTREIRPGDLLHVNDAEPLPARLEDDYPLFEAGDLLVSVRASNLVLVFDPETEVVKWYATDPFVQQHDPDFLGDGWIGVFNNNRDGTERGSLLDGTQIIAVQPHTDSVEVLFPTPKADPFYAPFLGKWEVLDNGNLLLTEGTAGRVVEVAPDGQTVWEWIRTPFDEDHTVEVTEGTKYPITKEEVARWPCSDNQQVAAHLPRGPLLRPRHVTGKAPAFR